MTEHYCPVCCEFVEVDELPDFDSDEYQGTPCRREYVVYSCPDCGNTLKEEDERSRCDKCKERPSAPGLDYCTQCYSEEREAGRLADVLEDIAMTPTRM